MGGKMKISLIALTIIINVASAKECFEAGSVKSIPKFTPDMFGYMSPFSHDRNSYLSNYYNEQSDKIKIYNFKTDETKEFSKELDEMVIWDKKGNLILYKMPTYENVDFVEMMKNEPEKYLASLKTNIVTIDPATGERKKISGKWLNFISGEIETPIRIEGSGENIRVITKNEKNETNSFRASYKQDTVLRDHNSQTEVTISSEGDVRVLGVDDALLYSTKISIPAPSTDGVRFYGNNGGVLEKKQIVIVKTAQGSTAKYIMINLKNKTHKLIDFEDTGNQFPFLKDNHISADGKKIFLESTKTPGLHILDTESGKPLKLTNDNIESPSFESGNNLCGINRNIVIENIPSEQITRNTMLGAFTMMTSMGQRISPSSKPVSYDCYDGNSGKKISSREITKDHSAQIEVLDKDKFIITPAVNGMGFGGIGFGGMGFGGGMFGNIQTPSPQNEVSYLHSLQTVCPAQLKIKDCDCDTEISPKVEFDSLQAINVNLACTNSFSEEMWAGLTPRPISELDEKQGLLWLKRFSKPNGFKANPDLDVLKALINEKAYLKYPSEFKAAISGVLFNSPLLLEELLAKYPQIFKNSDKPEAVDCTTKEEKELIAQSKRDYFKMKVAAIDNPTAEALEPVLDLGAHMLDATQKDAMAENIADLVVSKMGMAPELSGIFPSKVYKFAYNKSKEKLGIEHKKLTDLTTVRDGQNVSTIILATGAVKDSKSTLGGFHLSKVSANAEADFTASSPPKEINWDFNGKKYSAKVTIRRDTLNGDITPANLSPNYAEMKKDKPYRGLIVAGTNLGQSTTDNVVQEYLEYYSEQGFEFEEASELKDMHSFLKSRVSGEEPAHYFVKEAHSDGDEKNLFRINTSGKVLRGIKEVGGKKEIIEIVYPGLDQESKLISNAEFGEWMQKREKDGGSELVYLNSSCWSVSKATYEIAAAKTAKLINIPTTTSMTTFTNNHANVMHAAIDGLRKEKTYAEIREKMNDDPKYKSGHDNVMIFPDEERYRQKIVGLIKLPLSIDTKVFVEKNNMSVPYSIEEN